MKSLLQVRSISKNLFLFCLLIYPLITKAQVQGKVFRDFNENGVFDSTSTFKEIGLSGITVTAFNSAGSSVGTTSTNSTGNYTISAVTGAVRVEFSGFGTGIYSGPNGTNNKSSVQFVTAPTTSVNFGLNSPSDFCQTNPQIVLACYVNGSGVGSTNSAFITFPYNSSGTTTAPTKNFDAQTVGSVYGTAFQTDKKLVYTGAFLKRHSGLGPRGIDGVYVMDYSTATPSLKGGFNLNGIVPSNGGSAINLGSVTRTNVSGTISTGAAGDNQLTSVETNPNRDLDAFIKVGTIGYGDIDVSEDNQYLWIVNLNQQALIKVDISSSVAAAANPNTLASSKVSQYPLVGASGITACTNGKLRPFGLEFKNGKGYVGCVCDASSSSTIIKPTDLKAYVYSFDPANPTSFTQELSMNMNYTREPAYINAGNISSGSWQRWISTNSQWATDVDKNNTCCAFVTAPQPLLSDIDITEDGSMILSFQDRFTHQEANFDYIPTSGSTTQNRAIAAGDIVYAKKAVSGYTIEPSPAGIENPTNYPGFIAKDGPDNNGEYFYGDYYVNTSNSAGEGHFETSLGSSAYIQGLHEVAEIAFDPSAFYSQGVNFFNVATGAQSRNYQVLTTSYFAGFGKGSALGDLEVLCNPATIEIGNLVWKDTNNNGIQDAGEAGIDGVIVELYSGATKVGTSTTANGGLFYFNSSNVTGGLLPTTAYTLKIASSQFSTTGVTATPLAGLSLTTANATSTGAAGVADNNATVVSNLATIAYTTGIYGANDHTLDFGFVCSPPNLTSITAVQATCTGATANSNASVTVSGITGMSKYSFGTNGTTGFFNSTAIASTATSIAKTGLANPASATTYTFRLYASDSTCYKDTSIVLNPSNCTCTLQATATGTNVKCNGGTDGTATAVAANGTATYTYKWSDMAGQTTVTATGLKAGAYTVTITDAALCTQTATYTVTEPLVMSSVCAKTDATTFGGTQGTATATPSGGTLPYTFLWNDAGAQTTQTAVGLAAGSYTVTITDANGCKTTCSVSINSPLCPNPNCFTATVIKN